jgi:hypothetical protein
MAAKGLGRKLVSSYSGVEFVSTALRLLVLFTRIKTLAKTKGFGLHAIFLWKRAIGQHSGLALGAYKMNSILRPAQSDLEKTHPPTPAPPPQTRCISLYLARSPPACALLRIRMLARALKDRNNCGIVSLPMSLKRPVRVIAARECRRAIRKFNQRPVNPLRQDGLRKGSLGPEPAR